MQYIKLCLNFKDRQLYQVQTDSPRHQSPGPPGVVTACPGTCVGWSPVCTGGPESQCQGEYPHICSPVNQQFVEPFNGIILFQWMYVTCKCRLKLNNNSLLQINLNNSFTNFIDNWLKNLNNLKSTKVTNYLYI